MRVLAIAGIVLLLALLSIILNRVTGQAAVVWLPNSFAIAAVLMTERRFIPDILIAHAIGVICANLVYGDPFMIGAAFAVVNFMEVCVVAGLYRYAMGTAWPHETETGYIRFTVAVALTGACVSSAAGGTLVHFAFSVPWDEAYLRWIVGAATSLIGFVPVFLWLFGGRPMRFPISRPQILWTLIAMLSVSGAMATAVFFDATPKGFFVVIIAFCLFALKLGRVGVILATAYLLLAISATSFSEQAALISEALLNLGNPVLAFAIVFCTVALPANLIASMIERLETAERTQRDINAMKSEFLANMSHEIRTPMNAMHGMFQLLERSELTDRQRRWIDGGLSASEALQQQIDQVFQMARLERSMDQSEAENIDLREALSQWTVSAEGQIARAVKPLKVTSSYHNPAGVKPRLDPTQLNQIVLNLLSNAVKFSETGEISISVRASEQLLSVAIEDEGIGIDIVDQRMIFERFWQVDSGGARAKGGAGLGLAISMELANRLGGNIDVSSALGKGSCFTVIVPLK